MNDFLETTRMLVSKLFTGHPQENASTGAEIPLLSRAIIQVEGSLWGTVEILTLFLQTVRRLGEMEFSKALDYLPPPLVLPLVDVHYAASKTIEMPRLLRRVRASVDIIGSLELPFGHSLGKNILVCGFPRHIFYALHGTDTEIRVIEIPDLDDDADKALKESISDFAKTEKKPVHLISPHLGSIYAQINWADTIMVETYGFTEAGIYLPYFAFPVIMLAYGKTRTCVVMSELQRRTTAGVLLDGIPVPASYFTASITERGLFSWW